MIKLNTHSNAKTISILFITKVHIEFNTQVLRSIFPLGLRLIHYIFKQIKRVSMMELTMRALKGNLLYRLLYMRKKQSN